MGAHLIFFIIFTIFSCIILTNQSLPWYSLRSGFQCDTNMAAVFSVMRPTRQGLYLGMSVLIWYLFYMNGFMYQVYVNTHGTTPSLKG